MLGSDAREPVARTHVVGLELAPGGQAAGEQAADERGEGEEADAELLAGVEDLALDAALEQRVLALEARDRMDGGGATQVRHERFREADVADLARLDELRESSDRLLDRRPRVDAMLLVEVDRLDAEPAQARLARRADVLRASVEPGEPSAGTHDAELRRQHDLVASAADRAPDELLVVAVAVDVGGVEQRHAEIERAMDRRDAVGVGGAAVRTRHRHAAEADRRDHGTDASELAFLHDRRSIAALRRRAMDARRRCGPALERLLRPGRAQDEVAAAVGADAAEALLHAARAERALEGADPRVRRPVRQVTVAPFAIGSELEHGQLQSSDWGERYIRPIPGERRIRYRLHSPR